MTDRAVVVRGLREFSRDLRRVDKQLARQMSRAHKTVTDQLVAEPARRLASRLGGGHVRLARRGVISARARARGGYVALNSGRVPDAFGWEFGAYAFRQFPIWRGNQWRPADGGVGYVIHPTIRSNYDRIIDEYGDRLMNAFADAYPE
jgi:hypothetical protein